MTSVAYTIDSYKIRYYLNPTSKADLFATIELYNPDTSSIAIVDFYREGQEPPINTSNQGLVIFNTREHLLSRILDLLRNEKPCHISYDDVLLKPNIATGSFETVGEEETP